MYELMIMMLIGIAFKEWVKGHPGEVSMLLRRMALVCKVHARRFSKLNNKERDENKQLKEEMTKEFTDLAIKLIGEGREHILMECKSDPLGRLADAAREDLAVASDAHEIVDDMAKQERWYFNKCADAKNKKEA